MSRQNKVNPGMYTQRGRLTNDDAARELRKQRSVGSQHTWQPVKKDQLPRLESKDRPDGTETTEDKGNTEETSTSAETRAASRATARNMAPVKAKAKSSTAKSAKAAQVKTPTAKAKTAKAKTGRAKTAKAKTGKAAKTAAKRSASKPKRKAVLARNVGGGGATPRPAAKRRKS